MLDYIQGFDDLLLGFIQAHTHTAVLDVVMPVVSGLGNLGIIWIVTALVLICFKKHRAAGVTLLVALILCALIGNLGLKPLIARPRPCWVDPNVVLLIPSPSDYSFPSGHTFSSFAAATVLFWHSKRMGICAIVLAALIAFSRLYLFVHYPTDVLAGIILGIGFGLAAIFLYKSFIKRREKKKGVESGVG